VREGRGIERSGIAKERSSMPQFTEFTESKLISSEIVDGNGPTSYVLATKNLAISANRDLFRPRRPKSAMFGN